MLHHTPTSIQAHFVRQLAWLRTFWILPSLFNSKIRAPGKVAVLLVVLMPGTQRGCNNRDGGQ